MAENEANLIARFISLGATDVLKDMSATGAAGVANEKILNRLITLQQREASTAKLTAAATLEAERQKTIAMRNTGRAADAEARARQTNLRHEIKLLGEATASQARYASIIKSGGTGGGLAGGGALNMVGRAGLAGAVVFAGVRTLEAMSENAAKWEQLDVAIKDIEGSASGAALQLDRLYEIAKAPGIDLETGEKIYIKLRSVGIEGEKANRIVEQFAKTVAKSGGGSQELSRVVEQLVQMQSKGRILQEDLKFMANSMPRLRGMLEQAFGTSNATKLRDMGIDAKQFLDGVLAQMEKLDPATRTLQTSTENLSTAFSRLKADATPTEGLKSLYDWLTSAAEKASAFARDLAKANAEMRATGAIEDEYEASRKKGFVVDRVTGDTLQTDDTRKYRGLFQKPTAETRHEIGTTRSPTYYTGQTSQQMGAQSFGASVETAAQNAEQAKEAARVAAENKRARLARGEYTDEEKKEIEKEKRRIDKLNALREKERQDMLRLEKKLFDMRAADDQAIVDANVKKVQASNAANLAMADDVGRLADIEREMSGLGFEIAQEQAAAKAQIQDEYLKSDYDRQKEYYEKVRQMILDTTREGSEEQTQLLAAVNARQAQDRINTVLSAESQLASGVSGMFGDFANAYKMRTDYRYEREKASIDKTLSLNGLEGKARVAQQRKRDEALAQLDEKRQADMAGTYQTMFLISKGFALAESMLMLSLSIAKAAAGAPFPANLANMAAVAAATGSVVGNIAAISYSGAYNKGGDIPAGSYGMVGDGGPEFVRGPAHVTSVKDTAALMKPNVNVHNYSGQQVQVQQSSDGSGIDVIIGKIAKQVEDQLSTGMRSGRGPLSSAVKETFGLTRKGG